MPLRPDPEWQRDTSYPSAVALLTFLEADLDRGMRLAWDIETGSSTGPLVRRALVVEFEQLALEVERWIDRARKRSIGVDHLAGRIDQFHAALADARRRGE